MLYGILGILGIGGIATCAFQIFSRIEKLQQRRDEIFYFTALYAADGVPGVEVKIREEDIERLLYVAYEMGFIDDVITEEKYIKIYSKSVEDKIVEGILDSK